MFVSLALWFNMDSSDSEDDEDRRRICLRKLRDATNVFDIPEERSFIANFRINKEVFRKLLEEMEPKMREHFRKTYIPVAQRLATFLLFIGSGGFQSSIVNKGTSFMSRSSVSLVIGECLEIFEKHLCPKWITLDKSIRDENKTKCEFYGTAGIPGVVGCVGGTHVRIKAPTEDGKLQYYNRRKEFCCINVMAICDHNMTITYVDATNPGAIPDATVWDNSEAHQYFNSYFIIGKNNTWLLGNSAFKLQPYMITPYRIPTDERQEKFNECHRKTYSIIDSCFAVLKDRFKCIVDDKGLHYSPQKTAAIVNACCALHNICIFYKNNWLPPAQTANNTTEEASYDISLDEESETAHTIRDDIASNLS